MGRVGDMLGLLIILATFDFTDPIFELDTAETDFLVSSVILGGGPNVPLMWELKLVV